MKRVAIVFPVLNEAATIESLCREVEANVNYPIDFVFVDDGSSDHTLAVLRSLQVKRFHSKTILVLSRNFGQQQAIMEGLRAVPATSSQIVVMDSDSQDRPCDVPLLLHALEEDCDCAVACRAPATGNWFVNTLTNLFYALQTRLTRFPIPKHAGTFCAFNRAMLERLLEFQECEVYFPGIRAYVGMKQILVPVARGERACGKSRVGLWGLVDLSTAGLVGFSALPMRAVFLFGIVVTILCIVLGTFILMLRLTGVVQVMGFTSLAIFILGLFGVQITFTGLVGEYVGKLFIESKRRPRAIVKEIIAD